ncbi:CLUMA_CG009685, isoform A [Clunio marinus]|uniref:CLUMA_CG009685, isoform A n=1 Tax=Clunio marinus TaxID=568069 RepID=A0A1J1I9L1_9DIPT|nr:CLUMA_CG009685, isoform A [Clunio marinus]
MFHVARLNDGKNALKCIIKVVGSATTLKTYLNLYCLIKAFTFTYFASQIDALLSLPEAKHKRRIRATKLKSRFQAKCLQIRKQFENKTIHSGERCRLSIA